MTYDLAGTSSNSTIGFTTYNPNSSGRWVDDPPTSPSAGTRYVALENLTSGGDGEFTYTLSGTITFYTESYYYDDIELDYSGYKYAITKTSDEPVTVLVNNLKLGPTSIKDYRLGSSTIKKIYLGNTLVYGETTSPSGQYGLMQLNLEETIYLDSNAYDISINGITLTPDIETVIDRIALGDDDDDRAYYTGITSGVTPIEEIDINAYLYGQDNTLKIYVNEEWQCDVDAMMYVVVYFYNQVRYKM